MVARRFPHHLKITRQTDGSQDPNTKVYTGGNELTVYNGDCNAQELSTADQMQILNFEGDRSAVASYKLFFPVNLIGTVKLNDQGVLTFEDYSKVRIKILEFRRLDKSFLAKYLGDVVS